MASFLFASCFFLLLSYSTVSSLDCNRKDLPVDRKHCIYGINDLRRCFYVCDKNDQPWDAASQVCERMTGGGSTGRLALANHSNVLVLLDTLIPESQRKDGFWLAARTQTSYWNWLNEEMPVRTLQTYYQGCFLARNGQNWEMNESSKPIGLQSADWCRVHCRTNRYNFFTIRDIARSSRVSCTCGHKYGAYGEGYGCKKCLDGHFCGTDQLNAVYTVNPGYNKTHDLWQLHHPEGLGIDTYIGKCMATKTLHNIISWISDDCNERRKTYCVKDPPCFQGSEVGLRGQCYVPLRQNLTWADAVTSCREQGATMVRVTSAEVVEDLESFSRLKKGLGQVSYWLGASTLAWKWQTGTKNVLLGDEWADVGQSDPLPNNCIILQRVGKARNLRLMSQTCTASASFICETETWLSPTDNFTSTVSQPTVRTVATEIPKDTTGITTGTRLIIIIAASTGGALLLLFIIGLVVCCCCCCYCSHDRQRHAEERSNTVFVAPPNGVYPNDPHLMNSSNGFRYTKGPFNSAYRGVAPPSIISDGSISDPPPGYYKVKTDSGKSSDLKTGNSKSTRSKLDVLYAKPKKKKVPTATLR